MRPAPPLDDVPPPIMRPDQHRGASSAVVEEPIGAPGSPPPTTVDQLGADPPPAGPASPPTDAAPAAGSAGPAHPASVVLQRGDHLWAVAERHLAARLDHEPDDAEITAYWQRLITLNVDELADPANPDLVFSGQVIRLPPL